MSGISSVGAIPTALQNAVGGIQRSQQRLAQDAATVARAPLTGSGDLVAALIDSRQQVLYTSAAAKLISAGDEMLQSVIDIRA